MTDPFVPAESGRIHKGVRLPGFNDEFTGRLRDIGVFENGVASAAVRAGDGSGVLRGALGDD